MIVYNVETVETNALIALVANAIEEEKGTQTKEWFLSETASIRYKGDVVRIGRTFMDIRCQDAVERCLYCEEKMPTEGMYCSSLCETLDKEAPII